MIKTNKLIKRSSISVLLLSALLSGCSEKSMESHLADARNYVSQQQFDAAVVEYKNAIQKSPNAAEPRFELGRIYIQNKDYNAAEKELNKALELGYPANNVIPLLSIAYQQSGAENALAGVDYRADGMTAVESAEVGFYKLQALVQLGKVDDAQALIDDLSSLDTESVYKGLIESYRFIIDDDIDNAIAATETLRARSPLNKDVLQQLAKLYLLNSEQDKAIDIYSEYLKSYPDDVTSKFAYVSLLIEQRSLEKAEPLVDQLLALNENNPLLNTYKGIIESAQGKYAEALGYLELAIQNGRSDQVVRLVAGYSAYQIQDFEAAQRHLTMVASSLPDNHPGLRMLADSMLQLGENDEALEVLNRVEGEQTADARLFSKASYQLLREGNEFGARQMVEKSETVSESAEDLSRLGVLQLSLNDIEGIVNLEEAVNKAPDSATTQSTLLRAYVATNQFEKAKAAAIEWHEKAPETSIPLVYLGSIATVEGDFDAAKQYLEQASQKPDANNEVTYSKVNLLVAQGEKARALSLLDTFIQKNPADVQALTLWYGLASEQKNNSDVIKHVEREFNADRGNLSLRMMLAKMYSLNGELGKSLTLLEGVQGDENSPLAFWSLKGQSLLASNDVKKANAFFDRWLTFYPQDKNAVLGKLLILDSQNRFNDALSLLDKVLKRRTDAQLSLLKAYFHSRIGQSKPAWEIVNASTEQAKALPFVRGIIARLNLIDRKPEAALPHAEAAYEASKNTDNALLLMAVYDATEQREKSYSFIQEHVKNNPNDIQSSMLLAERQITDDRQAAMATYENVLANMPENFVVLNNLAYLAFEENDLIRAETLSKKAVSLQPNNAEAVDTLAQIHIAKGELESALKLYERIATQPIANDEVYLNHVELLLTTDKVTLAKRKLAERELSSASAKARAETLKKQYGI